MCGRYYQRQFVLFLCCWFSNKDMTRRAFPLVVRSTPPEVERRCRPEGSIQKGHRNRGKKWLVETLLGKQYFIAQSAGKSERKC